MRFEGEYGEDVIHLDLIWQRFKAFIFCRKGHDYVKPPGIQILKCRFCGKIH